MKTNDGGPAFPVIGMPIDPDTILNRPGISKRDWFAAHEKIDGNIDNRILIHYAGPMPNGGDIVEMFLWAAKAKAAIQYAFADAMLAESEKNP